MTRVGADNTHGDFGFNLFNRGKRSEIHSNLLVQGNLKNKNTGEEINE